MFFWLNFPLIRFFLASVCGMLVGMSGSPVELHFFRKSILLILILFLLAKGQASRGLLIFLLIALLGFWRGQHRQDYLAGMKGSSFLRAQAIEVYNKTCTQETSSFFRALVLGDRSGLTAQLRDSYANAGVIHVLAVSGLHMGIIFLVLHLIFLPLRKFSKGIYTSGIVSCFFLYAILTGLSPSVIRASLMLSLWLIGRAMGRKGAVYNAIAGSALLMTWASPDHLNSVGFQLSYVAVLGIVFGYPRLRKIYQPRIKLLSYFWNLTLVSICAQVATAPLVIHYFHQFPTYSLLANLWVIPGITLLLVLGIGILVLGMLLPSVTGLSFLADLLISWQNQSIAWVNRLPGSQITHLYLETPDVILIYMAMISIILILEYRKLSVGWILLFFLIMIQLRISFPKI